MTKFVSGVIPSKRDPRDYIYAKVAMTATNDLPSKQLPERVPIRNQGNWGTCVGHASAYILDYHARANNQGSLDFSPLFIYGECKRRDGQPTDDGTEPKIAFQVMQTVGDCLESSLPYNLFTNYPVPKPDQNAYTEALKYEVKSYAKIQTLDEIKHALVNQGPIMGAVLVAMNFEECEPGGFIPMPSGNVLGGHAICIDGYDDNMTHTYYDGTTQKGFLRFVNSWGDDWGDKGYGYIPYDFVNYRDNNGNTWFMEAWSCVDGVPVPPKTVKEIDLWIDKPIAQVDGQQVSLDQAPILNRNTNRSLVPTRFIAKTLGLDVQFDNATQKITIRR